MIERHRDSDPATGGLAPDLGELDWTIPPDTGASPGSRGRSPAEIAVMRFRAARIYGLVTTILTGVTLGWWVASGRLPANDPQAGLLMLVMHVSAFFTAWLALRATYDTWEALERSRVEADETPATTITVISMFAAAVMCTHTAMIVSSMIH